MDEGGGHEPPMTPPPKSAPAFGCFCGAMVDTMLMVMMNFDHGASVQKLVLSTNFHERLQYIVVY